MIEDIKIHESINHLSILELKEVTKRDRDRGIEVESKVIYTFYFIIVLFISLVLQPRSSFIVHRLLFIVYCSSSAAQFTTLVLPHTATLPSMLFIFTFSSTFTYFRRHC